MKLRLPHKLQAALIATLAAATFTTLSTGTTAQAWTAQTSTTNEYVSTTANFTEYGWNYNAETGEITAPNNIWNSFTFKLDNNYLSTHSGNEKMLYVTPAKTATKTWGFYATGSSITGLWQGGTWTNGGTKTQDDLARLADGEGKIILTAKINTEGTYLYSGEVATGTPVYGTSSLKSTGDGAVIKLTLSKNLVDSFLVSHTSATVTLEDETVKEYDWVYEQKTGRSDAIKTDMGYKAYIVSSGAEVWFASGAGTVEIAGDLYVAGTYDDGYGALRLGSQSGGTLKMNGLMVLGADTVISADSENASIGTVEINGEIKGFGHKLTVVAQRGYNAPLTINGVVNLGAFDATSPVTFGASAVASLGNVNITNQAFTNNGQVTVTGGTISAYAGTGTLTKTGDGDLTVGTCTATFNNLTVSGGSMTTTGGDFTINNAFDVTGSGTEVTFGGKVTMKRNARTAFNASGSVTTFNGGLDFSGPGGSGYAFTVGNGATLRFGGTSTVGTESARLSIGQGGGSTVVLLENATLTLNNLYNSSSLNGNGAVTLESGATLNVGTLRSENLTNGGTINATQDVTVDTISGAGTINVASTSSFVYGAQSNTGNKNGSYAGTITAGRLQKWGTGTLALSGLNTFYNETYLYKGTLEVAQVGSLGGQGVNSSAGTTTRFNLDADHSGTFGSYIKASGAVEKSGAGTLVFTGNNTYTGATTVTAGTLAPAANTQLASSITVRSGATLKLSAKPAAVTSGSITLEDGANLAVSAVNGTRARSGAPITAATAGGGFSFAPGANISLGGAYSGTVAVDPADNTKLVVSDVAQTGSIYHVYLLTGQSNSLGAVKDSPLSQDMLAAYQASGVQMYNANITNYSSAASMTNAESDPHWVQLAPQEPGHNVQAAQYYNNLCMGPEYGFAYMMQKNHWFTTEDYEDQDKLGVILASLDGGGNKYWVKGSNTGYTYNNILDNVKAALLEAKGQGCSAVSLDGLMYLQGETNDGTEAGAAATRYADFIANLRMDLESWMAEENITGIDLVFNTNSVTGEPRLGNGNRTTTANNLLAAATSDNKVNADMNGRGHVLTNDLAVTNCDNMNVHYTGDAQLTIGARYAYAFAVQNGIDVGAVRGQEYSNVTLDQAKAWWMEKVPGENDIAKWDISSSVSSANTIAEGQTLRVGGLLIEDVYYNGATGTGEGSVAINGGNLSLGADGIELTGADLTIGSTVDARTSQTWTAGDHTLTTTGTVTIAADQTLTIAEGSEYHFNVIEGSGNLSIGDGAVLGMTEADLQNHDGEIGYSDGENGYFSGEVVLVDLADGGTVTLGTGVNGEDALATGTIKVKDGDSSILLASVESNGHYQVRSGNVTYSTAKDIALATQIVINDMGSTGATLTLDSAWTGVTTPIVVEGNGGTISIGSDVVLSHASLNTQNGSITLAGTGEYVGSRVGAQQNFTAADVLGSNITLDPSFAGSVVLSGGNSAYGAPYTNIFGNLTGLYTQNSRVVLNDAYGFVSASSSGVTWGMNLELRGTNADGTGTALTITAGNGNAVSTFEGAISGKGDIFYNKATNSNETWKFSGDLANWTGKIVSGNQNTGGLDVEIQNSGDTAKQVGFGIDNSVGSRSVNLTVAGDANFSNDFAHLSALTVNQGVAATFAGTTEATGATTVNGSLVNDGTMTLNGLTMAADATFTNTGSLTLSGAVTFGSAGIVNSGDGTITLSSGNTFDLTNLTATEGGVYTLFTTADGGADVDLTRYHYTSANIVNPGEFTWIFGADGTVTKTTAAELVWAGTEATHEWNAEPDMLNWTSGGSPAAFRQGDKVTFAGGESYATAILGANVVTDLMTVNANTTQTVKNGTEGHNSLTTANLVLGADSTLSILGDADNNSFIAKVSSADGSTLTLENTVAHLVEGGQAFKGSLVIGDGAVFHVDATDSLKYSGTRTVTVKEGGTLQFNGTRWTVGVDSGSGSTTIDLQGGTITGNGDSNAALDLIGSSSIQATSGDSRIESVIRLRSDPTFTVAEGASLEITGQLKQEGNHKLTVDGGGTLALNSATASTINQLQVNAGTLEVGSPNFTSTNRVELSSGDQATGTLWIMDGGKLTTNNLYMADSSVVHLEANGSLATQSMTFNGIAPATEGGQESILHWIGAPTSATTQFLTSNTGFELLHGDLTTVGGNKTVSTLLTDSTVHVTQNLVLNNSGNTITAATLTGGTLTVGAGMQLGDVTLSGGNMTVNSGSNANVNSITVAAGKSGTITSNGIVSFTEGSAGMTVDGSLTLAGTGEYDLSNLAFSGDAHYTGGEHEQGETKYNGFSFVMGYATLATISGTGSIAGTDAVKFTYNHMVGDYVGDGMVYFEDARYRDFYINRGTESVSYARTQAEIQYREKQLDAIFMANGTNLTVDENINASLVTVLDGRATLDIQNGMTVTSDGQGRNITLNGSGTYKLQDTVRALESGVQLGANWTGIVELGGSIAGGHTFQGIYNADSFVKLNGVSTWIQAGNKTVEANLILEGTDDGARNNAALNITGTNAGTTYSFSGSISGSGDIAYTQTDKGDRNSVFQFSGDLADWHGNFVNYDGSAATHPTLRLYTAGDATIGAGIKVLPIDETHLGALDVVFGGSDTTSVTMNGDITMAEGSTLNLTAAKDTTFNGAVTASSLSVAGDMTATVAGGMTLAGATTLTGAGDLNVTSVVSGSGSITKAGTGTVTLGAANTYSGGTTVSAGTLVADNASALGTGAISMTGGTLEVGSNVNLTLAQNQLISNTGGTVVLNNGSGITVNAGAANKVYDLGAVEVNGVATITSTSGTWNPAFNIGALTGNADSTLNLETASKVDVATVYNLNGGEGSDFQGHVKLSQKTGGQYSETRLLALNINAGAETVLQGSDITLSNADSSKVGIGLNTDATVRGINSDASNTGGEHVIFSGVASQSTKSFVSGDDEHTLTIATQEGDNFSTRAKVQNNVNLTMSGAGSQTFNGDLSAMNGTVTANGGTLTLNNTGSSRGTLASVTYNGGTLVLNNMNVKGATTIGAGTTLDLGTTNLTSAIVNSGTVNFTQDITSSGLAKEGEDVSYQVGADDNRATNGNYFFQGQRTESTIRVVTGGTVNPGGHKVTQDNVAYTLNANGTATGVTADGVDYSVFYQGEAGTTVSVAQLAATAAKHDTELAAVYSIGAWQNPTVLDIDQNLGTAIVGFGTVNIGSGFDYTGDLLIYGGMNTVNGQLDIARVGFHAAQDSVTVFTDAPVVDGGVRFTSDQGAGGVQVQANKVSDSDDNYYGYDIGDSHYAVIASELSKEGGEDATVRNSLMVNRVHNSAENASGKLTLDSGVVAASLKEVTATSGDIQFMNMAAANATPAGSQTQVYLNNLEIGEGKTVSFYEGSIAEAAQEASVTVSGTLTADAGATLNADLEMASGSHLDVSATGGTGLQLGSTLTINPGMQLSDADLRNVWDLEIGGMYNLVYDVNLLEIKASTGTVTYNPGDLTADNKLDAHQFYNDLQENHYYVVFTNDGGNVGTYAIYCNVPEPTTGTLSLLALAALAARRRRK